MAISATLVTPSSGHDATNSRPSALIDGPHTSSPRPAGRAAARRCRGPRSGRHRRRHGGEHGLAVVAEGDVVDVEVVAGERRTDSPVTASRMSTIPASSGPSVTKVCRRGSSRARRPRRGHAARCGTAVTGSVQRLIGFGQGATAGAVVGPGTLDGFEGEEHAALGVDVEVGVGGRGELAGLGQAPLVGGAVALTDCDDPGDEGDDEGERHPDEQGAEAAHPARLAAALGVAPGPAGVEELLSVRFGSSSWPAAHSLAASSRVPR